MGRLIFILFTAFSLNIISVCVSYSQNSPETPYVAKGACPFECCTYTTWQADKDLNIYQNVRDTTSLAFTINEGTKFEALTGNVYITKLGKVVAIKPFTIPYYEKEWKVAKGDTLYLLNYVGEGYHKVWFKGDIIEDVPGYFWHYGEKMPPDSDIEKVAELLNKEEDEWWTKIEYQNKIGWLYMKGAKVTGPDACR